MNKWVMVFCFWILAGILLLACSPTPSASDEVVLNIFDYSPDAAKFWEVAIPMFEEENPGVQVNQESVTPDVFFELKTARLASGEVDILSGQPQDDLFRADSRALYLELTGQPFLNNFYPDLVAQGTIDGETYIVPTSMTGVVVFYNKDTFASLDLDVPQTWDEFLQVGEKLKEADVVPVLFGGQQQWPVAMHIIALETGIVRSAVPDFYDGVRSGRTAHDDPVWIEVFEKLAVLSEYYQEFAAGQDYDQIPTLFARGEGAMIIDGIWQAGAITGAEPDFEVGIFSFPGSEDAEDNRFVSTKMGNGFLVVRDSPNTEEAIKFLEFFSRPDVYQLYVDATGQLPAQPTAEITDPVAQTVLDTFEEEQYQQVMIWENLVIPGATYDFDPIGMAVVTGEMTGEEAAKQLQQNIMDSRDAWE